MTGAGGFVGAAVRKTLEARPDLEVYSTRSPPPRRIALDLETPGAAAALVHAVQPQGILHAAARSSIAGCEKDPGAARRINAGATLEMAEAAGKAGARFVFLSTDQVFDGESAPYTEASPVQPLHAYGRSKAEAEAGLLALGGAAILRLALVFGDSPSGVRSASEMVTTAARSGKTVNLFTDEIRTPVSVDSVVQAAVALLDGDFAGLLNLGGRDRLSRHALGLRVCTAYGLDPGFIRAVRAGDLDLHPPRPRDLTLVSDRAYGVLGFSPDSVEEALEKLAGSGG